MMRWPLILLAFFVVDAQASPEKTTLAPVLIVTPSSLTFAPQAFETYSAPQFVTVRSQGISERTPLVVGWVSCNADPLCATPDQNRDFSVSSTCWSVDPGGSCSIQVNFRPHADGLRRATLTINDIPVDVSGTGTGAKWRIEPDRLAFPPMPVGMTSPPQTATVTNLDSVAHDVSMYRGGVACVEFSPCPKHGFDDFAFTPSCTAPVSPRGDFVTLPPGGSCTVQIAFTPSGSGMRYGDILLYPVGTLWFNSYIGVLGTGIDAEWTTRLNHVSARGRVGAGNDVLIAGFVVGGLYPKTMVVRARGPSLGQYGIQNPLANPAVQLVRMSDAAVIASNDNHFSYATYGSFVPPDSREAYIEAILPPGAYTAIVSGVGGAAGIATAEVFEVDRTESPFINLSVRGRVGVGEDVLIAGFAVDGPTSRDIVVRARGPSLAAFGIDSALADPSLYIVRSSDQTVIASNDNWGDDPNATRVISSGMAPANALEAAIYITLPPGLYTAIVSGVGGTTGTATMEVFAK